MAETSRTMLETKGMIWVTKSNNRMMITTMVSTARNQSGADFPLTLILRKRVMMG